MFKIAKQMRNECNNIVRSKYVTNKNGTLEVKEEEVIKYLFFLFAKQDKWLPTREEDKVEGSLSGVTEQIVEQALKSEHESMKARQRAIWGDKWSIKAAGATGMKGLFQVCKSSEQEGNFPEQWDKSYTILVYKGKQDGPMVGKHRGVRLLEQDMKLYIWENPREEA